SRLLSRIPLLVEETGEQCPGIRASSSGRRRKFVLADDAARRGQGYLQGVTRERLWTLARVHWFDAVLLAFLGVGLAESVLTQNDSGGPQGPLWFDILLTLATIAPL